MRVIVRRQLPHPGATLDAEIRDGYRYQAFTTNHQRADRAAGSPPSRARPRRGPHPHRQGHRPGPPASRHTHINAVWIELSLIAADLLAFAQTMLLSDEPELHRAEPKTLRYRLLDTAARITRGQRRVFLRLALALDPRARPGIPAPAAHPASGLTALHHPGPHQPL